MRGEGGGVCFSVFYGFSLFVFLLAKKLYVLKLQRRNFGCFNGEKKKEIGDGVFVLVFWIARKKIVC